MTSTLTNMQIAERISISYESDPYFSKDVHAYLLSKGGRYKQHRYNLHEYAFDVKGETVRLLFNNGLVKIQVLWLEEDPDRSKERMWLTSDRFSMPTGPDVLPAFKKILNAYIESL